MMKNILIGAIYLSLILVWVFIIYIGYLAFYPFKVVTFKDPVFPVITKQVKPGGILIYISDSCKYTDVAPQVFRSFVNGLVFPVPPMYSTRPQGCRVSNVSVNIPDELPAGKYHLNTVFTYKINPIRTVTFSQSTEEFEVIE